LTFRGADLLDAAQIGDDRRPAPLPGPGSGSRGDDRLAERDAPCEAGRVPRAALAAVAGPAAATPT